MSFAIFTIPIVPAQLIIFILYIEFSRLLPTAPCIARVLETEFEYDSYRLPAGVSKLLLVKYSLYQTCQLYHKTTCIHA